MPKKHRTSSDAQDLIRIIIAAAKSLNPPVSEAELARRADITPVTFSLMKKHGRGDVAVIADMARVVGLRLTLAPDDEIVSKLQSGRFFDD